MKLRWLGSLIFISFTLISCQQTPIKQDPLVSALPTVPTLADANAQLQLAQRQVGPKQPALLLTAAATFMAAGAPNRALEIVKNIMPESLSDSLYAKHLNIQSRALLSQGNRYRVKGLLESTRANQLFNSNSFDTAWLELREMRAQLYTDINEPLLAITERMALDQYHSPGEEQLINQELLWMGLMALSTEQLKSQYSQTGSSIEKGWFTLASLSKSNYRNLNQQYSAIEDWQLSWHSHPANKNLPADLRLIREMVNNQPSEIALLLPLSGKLASVGAAIRNGFMAALYTNQSLGGSTPSVKIYDVGEGDINEHYDLAVSQGAQTIIGPLDKANISSLAMRPSLPIPTLALNTIEPSNSYPQELFQLGLSIEDEARQAAARAYSDGNRNAIVLTPNSSHGTRAAAAFSEHWQSLGGIVLKHTQYRDEKSLSTIIEQSLLVNQSKARARNLRRLVGNFKYEPRRRQDVDMVFLVSQPRQGRQIKPLLAFHYAGDIPVYSTSSIYDGSNKIESDLNGVYFSNLPWFFSKSAERHAVTSQTNLSIRSQRLYALGVDAFYLHPRLKQFDQTRRARFWGETGMLALSPHRQFERSQQWAMYKNGRVKPLLIDDNF